MKIIPATNDFVFKYAMGSELNVDVLKEFLAEHLSFDRADELDTIEPKNPFLLAEFKGDKSGILDIKCKTKNGNIIDVEMQVANQAYLAHGAEFYLSKMILEQIGTGKNSNKKYSRINPVMSILILATNMYDDEIYHHCFARYDTQAKVSFYGHSLSTIHVLELGKLKKEDDGTSEWLWGKLFRAQTEDELEMLSGKKTALSKAAESIRYCSQDKKMREIAESYEKARLDRLSIASTLQGLELERQLAEEKAARAEEKAQAAQEKAVAAEEKASAERAEREKAQEKALAAEAKASAERAEREKSEEKAQAAEQKSAAERSALLARIAELEAKQQP